MGPLNLDRILTTNYPTGRDFTACIDRLINPVVKKICLDYLNDRNNLT